MDLSLLDAAYQYWGTADYTRYQVIRQPMYDYVRYPAAGGTQLTFFNVPIGGTDPNSALAKTDEQTNLVKSASFGQVFYVVTQVRMDVRFLCKSRQPAAISGDTDAVFSGFCGDTLANGNASNRLLDIMGRGLLVGALAQKEYFRILNPFIACPPGYGVDILAFGASKPAANNAIFKSFWVQPDNDFNNVYQESPVMMIAPEMQLGFSLQFPDGTSPALTNSYYVNDTPTTATPNVEVGLIFDGYQIRPQQ